MASIVIVAYGSLGDIHPAIALAQALQSRRHHAAIATSEPYREKITAAGVTFHAVRPDLSLSDETMVRRVMDGRQGSEYLMRKLVYPAARDMHADLLPIASNADFLIGAELACVVPTVALQLRLRWAYFSLSPLTMLSAHDPSVLPGPPFLHRMQSLGPAANRFVHWLARIVSYSWWRPLRQLRWDLGLLAGRSPLFAGKFSPWLNLALFSRVLQRPQPDWPKPCVQTGFLFHDEGGHARELPDDVRRFLASGSRPLVFTLGSAAVHLASNFYIEAARAARLMNRRALLLLGRNPAPPDLPPSILAWDYLPFARILPSSAAIIHQGGVGTTGQALRAGHPMLVMPFAHDQFDNAARVTRLGVGRQIARENFTAESAARELTALLRDCTDQAAAIGAEVRRERGAEEACNAIERVLGTG